MDIQKPRYQQCLHDALRKWYRRSLRLYPWHPLKSLVGINPVKIVRPAGRRLNSQLPGCSQLYIDSLEKNITRHRLLEQLFEAHTKNYSDEERARIIMIDKEGKAYMRLTEKICRKINCCCIPFSPKIAIAIWICWVQVYFSLLRYHKGKIKNCGNLRCAAWRCIIPDPLQLSIQKITHKLERCKIEVIFYQEHGKCFQWNHLKNK